MPQPGQKYNSTKVKKEEMDKFDEELLEILKPYNVRLLLFRTQIVTMFEWEMNLGLR